MAQKSTKESRSAEWQRRIIKSVGNEDGLYKLENLNVEAVEDAMLSAKDWMGEEPKFTADDMNTYLDIDGDMQELRVWTHRWLGKVGSSATFDFVREMFTAWMAYGRLTDGQAKGVANCILAAARKRQPKPQATATRPASTRIEEAGMYKTPDGTIYKVQLAVHGSGNLYAKRLVVTPAYRDEPTVVHFEYEAGALKKLTPEMRMTLEEAKAFGVLYGTCCVCGRTLTDERSITEGIGPICSGRL